MLSKRLFSEEGETGGTSLELRHFGGDSGEGKIFKFHFVFREIYPFMSGGRGDTGSVFFFTPGIEFSGVIWGVVVDFMLFYFFPSGGFLSLLERREIFCSSDGGSAI